MSITSRITDPFMYVEQYYVHIICAIFNEIVKQIGKISTFYPWVL